MAIGPEPGIYRYQNTDTSKESESPDTEYLVPVRFKPDSRDRIPALNLEIDTWVTLYVKFLVK